VRQSARADRALRRRVSSDVIDTEAPGKEATAAWIAAATTKAMGKQALVRSIAEHF